jgi:hypothetical protein
LLSNDPLEVARSSYSLKLHIAHLHVTLDLRPLRSQGSTSPQN